MGVLLIVGTVKGAFLCRSEEARQSWRIEGPLFKGWKVTTSAQAGGRTFLGTASDVYGPGIHLSEDLSKWSQVEAGPSYPQAASGKPQRKLTQIWTLVAADDQGSTFFAGVDEAGLFRSQDRGQSWQPVSALNDHATRELWQPGAGGLCAHSLLVDRANPKRLWCGISAVGVFRSEDGGETWQGRNQGVPSILEYPDTTEIGYCVHSLIQDVEDPDTLYRQDHLGMFRSRDGAESWERTENGLPARFGFPLAQDNRTKALYCLPLESDEYRLPPEGRFRVYRSRDGADSWEALTAGLPQENAYAGVLRQALAVDHLDPCGVYVGTTSGTLHASADGGDSWQALPCTLPRILSVRAYLEA